PPPPPPLVTGGTLSQARERLVRALLAALSGLPGVLAVALAGSYARGRARAGSDIDLGLLYQESEPFSVDALRVRAARWNDAPDAVVTGFYEWGPWVNGGARVTCPGPGVAPV